MVVGISRWLMNSLLYQNWLKIFHRDLTAWSLATKIVKGRLQLKLPSSPHWFVRPAETAHGWYICAWAEGNGVAEVDGVQFRSTTPGVQFQSTFFSWITSSVSLIYKYRLNYNFWDAGMQLILCSAHSKPLPLSVTSTQKMLLLTTSNKPQTIKNWKFSMNLSGNEA